MLAHADERIQGVSVRRVIDLHCIAKFKMAYLNRAIALASVPAEMLDVMDATYRVLDDVTIYRDTGLNREQSGTALTRLKKRFSKNPDGTLSFNSLYETERDRKVLECFTGYVISKGAYNNIALFNEFKGLMIRHKFLDQNSAEFDQFFPHLSLYAIASMHGVNFLLPCGTIATAAAGWQTPADGDPRLGVTITFPGLAGQTKTVPVGLSLFETDLNAADWVDGYEARRHATWDLPIEVTSEPKLRALI
ncbi:hypothetical protein [Sphingomonas sp. SRS2]|uniref:hypothetical protein n=1 Tax=Sphingomonas sp. SRS2 TaxID=133190 RepID=UPI000B1D277E|nr:hypothetical protein [Sphingomonas sp. SRS2]